MSENKQQQKKLKELLDKGAVLIDSVHIIKMPDGSTAKIDRFGRVTWIETDQSGLMTL